jgi:hypothetical protein
MQHEALCLIPWRDLKAITPLQYVNSAWSNTAIRDEQLTYPPISQASTVFINEVFKQIPADTGARRLALLKVSVSEMCIRFRIAKAHL